MTDPQPDPAAARWFTIQAVRLLGVACVVVGLLDTAGKFPLFDGLPEWVGYLLIANGLFDVFVVPAMMARRWRSPPP